MQHIFIKMKTALVLEGGAMRGLYTAGVLDVFLDNKIETDAVYGTSAGVLFGVNYISEQRGRTIRYNKTYASDPRYMGFRSLLTTGNIINKDFAFYEIPFKLDVFDQDTFSKSKTKLYATVTNVHTGQVEYHQVSNVLQQMEILRATSAMPFVSKMVKLDEQYYLDGGLADSIPLKKCIDDGYEKIIVVLTRPLGYKKQKSSRLPAKLFYKKYPNLINTINSRYIMYNKQIAFIKELEKERKIIVVRPSKRIKIGRIEKDTERLQAIYDLGINDCKNLIETIKMYLYQK